MVSAAMVLGVLALAAAPGARAQTGLTDLFSWGLDYIGTEAKSEEGEEAPLATRECSCEGAVCNCCVNFNVTFIDLGGPGCVKLKYLSQAEGLMVNVSYGDNVLHSEQVKASNPEPACMDLLSDLAQLCARFTELVPEGAGLRGCAVMEPTLLGDVQAQYSVGCFTMGPEGMKVDTSREPVTSSSEEQSNEESSGSESAEGSTERPDLSEEALINAVNESAEEGIAWLTGLLGFNFGSGGAKPNGTEAAQAAQATQATQAPSVAPAQKSAPVQRQRSFNAIPVK